MESSFHQGFKNMIFLQVIVGFRINGNGFGELGFQGSDQMFFPAVKQLGNVRMDLDCEPVAHDIPGFGHQIPVNFVADRFF